MWASVSAPPAIGEAGYPFESGDEGIVGWTATPDASGGGGLDYEAVQAVVWRGSECRP
jgi:hypothetical protein